MMQLLKNIIDGQDIQESANKSRKFYNIMIKYKGLDTTQDTSDKLKPKKLNIADIDTISAET